MDKPRITRERILTIRVEEDGIGPRMSLIGELDLSNTGLLEDELHRIENEGAQRMVIDLSELRYIDSRGIACLLHALRRSCERNTELRFVRGPEPVEQVFQVSGIADAFEFDPE